MDRVVWDSWHKFVYYDDESIGNLRLLEGVYFPKIDSEEPIIIYVMDEGLPKVDTTLKLDSYRIGFIYEHYYEIVIFLAIIDKIANYIEHSELNTRLKSLFRLCSCIRKEEINDINTLRTMLIDSKNMYKDGYIEYMETGKTDFYNNVPIPFIMMDCMIPDLKKAIGLNKYFSFMLEFDGDISIYTCKAINDYIASRCTGYLSMNVLLHDDSEWKTWYSNNGQFIQETHDYTEIDLRKQKTKCKNIQN